MLRTICISLTLLGLLACNNKIETVKVTEENGDMVEYTRKKSDYAKYGEYIRKSENGKIIEKAFYENDTLHGERILYFENGEPEIVEGYKKGIFSGPYKRYYEDGKIRQEGMYEEGNMEGEWKAYYPSGQLKEVVLFKGSQENGPFTEYHENGNMKAEGAYLDGDFENGLLKLYDENGEMVKKMDCVKGICKTIWTKENGDVVPDKS